MRLDQGGRQSRRLVRSEVARTTPVAYCSHHDFAASCFSLGWAPPLMLRMSLPKDLRRHGYALSDSLSRDWATQRGASLRAWLVSLNLDPHKRVAPSLLNRTSLQAGSLQCSDAAPARRSRRRLWLRHLHGRFQRFPTVSYPDQLPAVWLHRHSCEALTEPEHAHRTSQGCGSSIGSHLGAYRDLLRTP